MEYRILEIIKEIEEINNRALKRDRKKVYQEMVDKSVRVEYSKGGEMSTFGVYDIEPFSEKLIINYRKGRKIKDVSKGFSFKYYFDENDNLIMWEKWLDNKFYNIRVVNQHDNIKEIVCYTDEVYYKYVYEVYKCEYDDKQRIIRVLECGALNLGNDGVRVIEELLFEYIDDHIYVTKNRYSKVSSREIPYLLEAAKLKKEKCNKKELSKLVLDKMITKCESIINRTEQEDVNNYWELYSEEFELKEKNIEFIEEKSLLFNLNNVEKLM